MIIVDTDFLFALLNDQDPSHEQAVLLSQKIDSQDILMTNLVKFELISLISYRINHQKAIEVLNLLEEQSWNYIQITTDLEKQTLKLFSKQTKKRSSFVDCLNLYLAQKLNLKIASFDQFYKSNLVTLSP